MTGQSDLDIRHDANDLSADLYCQKPLYHDLFKKVAKNGVPDFGANERNV